jgi:hypothetical protein
MAKPAFVALRRGKHIKSQDAVFFRKILGNFMNLPDIFPGKCLDKNSPGISCVIISLGGKHIWCPPYLLAGLIISPD